MNAVEPSLNRQIAGLIEPVLTSRVVRSRDDVSLERR